MASSALRIRRIARPVRSALQNDFVRHSALVFGASMAGNVLNYVFNVALSHRLGVEGFAELSSLTSFLMILSIPTSVLTLIVVKYASVFHAAGEPARIRRLSQLLLKWTLAVAVLVFVAGALLRTEVAQFLRIDNPAAIVVAVAVIALGLVNPGVRGILQGEQDFLRYSISTVLEVFLKVAVAVALVYSGFGVVGAMLGWTAGTACALAYTAWAVLRKHGDGAVPVEHLHLDARRLIQTTVGVGLATGFLTFISFMDVLLVKHYFPPHEAGLYAAANLTGKVVLFLAGFVPAVMLPKAIARSSRGENAIPLLLQAASVTILMSGTALAIFGSLSRNVVRILAGRDFIAAAPYVLQYDASMCMLAILTLLVNYRIGIHRFQFLYGLGAILVAEVAAIAVFHSTLWEVVHITLFANAAGILVCIADLRGAGGRMEAAPS